MKKIKVFVMVGTRPEVIKMASVIKKLQSSEYFQPLILAIGQHKEMLQQALDVFSIKPDYSLDIMEQNQSPLTVTGKIIQGLDELFKRDKPDIIMVQGDTTSVMATSLVAFYNRVKVAHVEAGLRSYDKQNPYPEEVNRCLTSILTDIHFAPTEIAKNNLLKENIDEKNIIITGNTVIDALFMVQKDNYNFKESELKRIKFDQKRIILVTIHRRENLGEPLINICKAINRLVEKYEDIEIIYPVHLNPNVRKEVFLSLKNKDRIHLLEPIDYDSLVNVMSRCYFILTDSGGIQEEAPSFNKPVLVLRKVTERPEGVRLGIAKLVGTDSDKIVEEVSNLLENPLEYQKMSLQENPYGDGKAAERIVTGLIEYFTKEGYCDKK